MWHRLITMKLRYAPILALLLIAPACGDDPDASGPPILVVNGSGVSAPTASADAAAGVAESKMMAPWRMNFVAGADLPSLDSDAQAYEMKPGSFSADDVATLGALLGIDGAVEEIPADQGGGYRMGADDGSTDTLWVSGDATGYWSYSPKWNESASTVSCAPSDGTTEPLPCEIPEPPANVPSEDEARRLFADFMGELGIDPADLVLETYVDKWNASIYGYLKIDGVRSPMSVSVSYGAEGALSWASGFLGTVEPAATYPRIGTAAALERLNTDYANPMLRGGIAIDAPVAATSSVASSSSGSAVAADGGVEVTPDTSVSDVIPVPETIAPDQPIDTTVIVDTIPVDIPVEVQDVTIVSVEEELIMLYSIDGSVYLVPGYAFIAEADEYGYQGRYTVSALPDEYIQQSEPVAVEPAVIEPAVDPVVDPTAITDQAAAALVGLSESEAVDTAKANGWESRVVSRDGEALAVTTDYRMDRVNLTIVDGVVTKSAVG